MACHSAANDELTALEGEPSTDDTIQLAQNSFKYRNFFFQMDFNPGQPAAITKVLLKLNLNGRFRPSRAQGCQLDFFFKAMREVYLATTTGLYYTGCIRDVELRQAMWTSGL